MGKKNNKFTRPEREDPRELNKLIDRPANHGGKFKNANRDTDRDHARHEYVPNPLRDVAHAYADYFMEAIVNPVIAEVINPESTRQSISGIVTPGTIELENLSATVTVLDQSTQYNYPNAGDDSAGTFRRFGCYLLVTAQDGAVFFVDIFVNAQKDYGLRVIPIEESLPVYKSQYRLSSKFDKTRK